VIPVAVVGIDCRFPGAPDKDAYWRLLMDGIVTDSEVPAQRWDVDAYYRPDGAGASMNTRRAHFIEDADAFDNEFFGIAPIEAAALDPQQRLLLQTSWRALEDAAIDPRSLAGTPTGVFVGMMSSEWGVRQMLDLPRITVFRGTGSGYFMAANRISYHLNLTGPSMAIDSACSSSLMAVHQGCVALNSGEADTVIAAGANLLLTPALSIFYTQAGLSAPDGRCKPFGQRADGIGRGDGVAAVVLRRLDEAVAAGQPIYAVVTSSVANHDGRSNGITAPNRQSQVTLMSRALDLARLQPGQIDFVEAHGTGTILGDMIEANALGDIHKERRANPCLLGSVKGNIGHTEGSAGIAAFIKACLALHNRTLPPTLFGDRANPRLRLEEHGLRLPEEPEELPADGAAGAVSSFGLGGSNVHAILQSAPPVPASHTGANGVLSLSAPTEQALQRNVAAVVSALHGVQDDHLESWCRTTNVVKRSQRWRLVLEGNRSKIIDGLREFVTGARTDLTSSAPVSKVPAGVGLLCSGQGTQYLDMTRPLYEANATYRGYLDTATAALGPHLQSDLRSVIFGAAPGLDHTSMAQPALFAISYALGKTLLQSGVRPSFVIGHSVGELAAACLAGVLSLDDATRVVALRGRLIGSLPAGGAMIAVDLDADQAEALVAAEPECVVAAVNGPRSVTISGASGAVDRVAAAVHEDDGKVLYLNVSHAFHSPLMKPIADEFRNELSKLTPGPSEFPIFSTVLGREVDGQELHGDYWADQICSPVRFLDAVRAATAAASTDYVVEAGPRPTLLALTMQCGLPSHARLLPLCDGPDSAGTELLVVAATMLRDGYSLELSPLYGTAAGPLRRLPPYVFDSSSRYWFDGATAAVPADPSPVSASGPERIPCTPASEGRAGDVVAVIAAVGGYPVDKLDRSTRLVEDLGYDSLLQLRLIDRLRTKYPQLEDITVAEVLPKIHDVGNLVDFVEQWFDRAGVNR
jgi:acyl transferase domain-containing protein